MTDRASLDQKTFLKRYRLAAKDLESAEVTWAALEAIYRHHLSRSDQLQKTADYIMGRLREVAVVHSVKVRVKHPEHLIEKIIRKRLANELPDITVETYPSAITDLIGLRALHLFKGDWLPIHEFVKNNWELQEQPIAFIREGDSDTIRRAFENAGCRVTVHPFGYRSLHYLLSSRPALETHVAELQVRTLFEEAWSEVDHRVRYPRESDNVYLADFLNLFNRIAGSADEMGTFIQALSQYVAQQEVQQAQTERQLKETISQLKVSETEKKRLADQVDSLRKSAVGPLYTVKDTSLPSASSIFGTAFPSSGVINIGTAMSPPSTGFINVGAIINPTKVCTKCGAQFTEALGSVLVSDKCYTCRFTGTIGG